MEIFETYPAASAVIVIFLFLSSLLIAILSIRRINKEVRKSNEEASEKAVLKILDQLGWERKQRWVNDNEIEFVSILNGHTPEQYKTWARVRVSKKSLGVIIEHAWGGCDRVDLDQAEEIATQFRKRNISVSTRCAWHQPSPEEIYVPDPPVVNEFDSPNPPFSKH